ncbi:hypothetical protein [Pseudomonas peli]|uniref:hypothetical protein n=1 Tax=Pseudomonas peli TaxID=592361 RepID=UPI0024ADF1E2|nr:hypothetical protein [Pseudomonas peli]
MFSAASLLILLVAALGNVPELHLLTERMQRFYLQPHATTTIVRDVKYDVLYSRRLVRESLRSQDRKAIDGYWKQIYAIDTRNQFRLAGLRNTYPQGLALIEEAELLLSQHQAFRERIKTTAEQGQNEQALQLAMDNAEDTPSLRLTEKLDEIGEKS